MHSFSNGTSLATKRDNWAQIRRLLERRNIQPGGEPLTEVETEEIIHAKPTAVSAFINRLYEFLTGRKAPQIAKPKRDTHIPSYARRTASRTLTDKVRDPKVEVVKDHTVKESTVCIMSK